MKYWICSLLFTPLLAWAEPIADVHLHWKWNQKEVTTLEQAVSTLKDQQVKLAVVTGTPPNLALELHEAAPDIVIPILGLYPFSGYWSQWHIDKKLIPRIRKALATGKYRGIGEVHLIGGFVSHWDTPNIRELFRLAAEYDVPALVHTEFSRPKYMIGVCQAHPQTRFLWAHAGSSLKPKYVAEVLEACPNVWVELSARDPWRHVHKRIADDTGKLLPAWDALIRNHSERFMIGSDTVWPVDRLDSWDEADTGWQELPRFLDFHRQWLAHLPTDMAEQIRWRNARQFFPDHKNGPFIP